MLAEQKYLNTILLTLFCRKKNISFHKYSLSTLIFRNIQGIRIHSAKLNTYGIQTFSRRFQENESLFASAQDFFHEPMKEFAVAIDIIIQIVPILTLLSSLYVCPSFYSTFGILKFSTEFFLFLLWQRFYHVVKIKYP